VSVERQGGAIGFQCDSCPEFFESEERDFNAALSEAKGAGWRAYPVGGVWCHACPDCKREQ
jgi:hypothetical protein